MTMSSADLQIIKNLVIRDQEDVMEISTQLSMLCIGFENLLMRGVPRLNQQESDTLSSILRNNESNIWKNIDIHHCDSSAYEILCVALERNIVEQVKLVNVETGKDGYGLHLLGKALATNTSLKYIRMTTNLLDAYDITPLMNGLQRNTTLETLDLKYTTFGGIERCNELARGLRLNRSIRSINLSGCNLIDQHAETILRALGENIETIDLTGNCCGYKTSVALADFLLHSSSIKRLDLGFQRANTEDHDHRPFNSKLLFDALHSNQSLQVLDISNMALVDDDAKNIAKVLLVNTSLRELYLSRNRFTLQGITCLAECLPQIKGCLKKLSLWGNNLTEEAASRLLNALQDNYDLECLELFQEFQSSQEISHLTLLNRGGRKVFQNRCPNTVPLGLWPYLFERINTRRMAKRPRRSDDNDISAKAEAIFYFLQSPALLHE